MCCTGKRYPDKHTLVWVMLRAMLGPLRLQCCPAPPSLNILSIHANPPDQHYYKASEQNMSDILARLLGLIKGQCPYFGCFCRIYTGATSSYL